MSSDYSNRHRPNAFPERIWRVEASEDVLECVSDLYAIVEKDDDIALDSQIYLKRGTIRAGGA